MAEYVRLRSIKSQEEIDWLRIGAGVQRRRFESLLHGPKPGMTERELGNLVGARLCRRGRHYLIHFIGVTSMAAAAALRAAAVSLCAQSAAGRRGFSASCRACGGLRRAGAAQASRSGGADAALPRPARGRRGGVRCGERRGAPRTRCRRSSTPQRRIEERGFTVCDDLMHASAAAYFQPIVGTKSRPAGPLPDMT